jgi:hypothetical protein
VKRLLLGAVLVPSALLAASDRPASAIVAADRAYDKSAGHNGEWTAMRAAALPASEMLVPQRVKVLEFGRGLPDPEVATRWHIEQAWISCDGTVGVSAGRWTIPRSTLRGWYEAIWARMSDGSYRMLLHHGGSLPRILASKPGPDGMRAACGGSPPPLPIVAPAEGVDFRMGASHDQSLIWSSAVNPAGRVRIVISLWDGTRHVPVLEDVAPEPVPR